MGEGSTMASTIAQSAFKDNPEAAARLQSLLIDGTRYAPHYLPSGNSDHLPMLLCALVGLGADEDTLSGMREEYTVRLHEFERTEAPGDPQERLGDRMAYPAFMTHFAQEAEHLGLQALLEKYIPTFLPGVVLDAYHPVIRLGYALDFDAPDEVAASLAYMASVHRTFDLDAARNVDLREVLTAQAALPARKFESQRFTASIMELVRDGEYEALSPASIDECAAVALDAYRGTRNFFALHLVTATMAVRSLVRILPAVEPLAVTALGSAIVASHKVLGNPAFDEVLPAPKVLDPEHAYKYAYVCKSEYAATGDSRYLEEIEGFKDAGLIAAWAG